MIGRFWWGWPSLITEMLSGILLVLALQSQGGNPPPFRQLLAAEAMSIGYEAVVDANGWNTNDVIQRHQGIVLAVSVTAIIRAVRHK